MNVFTQAVKESITKNLESKPRKKKIKKRLEDKNIIIEGKELRYYITNKKDVC